MRQRQIKVVMKTKDLTAECDRQEFGLALKTWRLRQAMTQREVADRWHVSRWTIMRAERARPITWEMAYRLFNKLADELENEKACDTLHSSILAN